MSELILEVVEGADAGKRIVVDRPIVIGRDPGAGFVLEDSEVSRLHLRLSPSASYVTVEDLGSANGTFVNHNELHGPARLDPGDELLVGTTVMALLDPRLVAATHSGVIAVPPALAIAPRTPTYADPKQVAKDLHGEYSGTPELDKYLDVRVRRRAVNAPWLMAVLVAAVLSAYFLTRSDHMVTASAAGPVAGWVYVNANTPTPNKNAVVAVPYNVSGRLMSQAATSYPTAGTGSGMLPLPNAVGTSAGDHQVLLSDDHKLLFAVNQGSNSIAVLNVDSQTGALKPVAGSPFFSFGTAPIGLGYSKGTLVVANHGVIAPFNPGGHSPPGPSNLVSFKVSAGGALTRVANTDPGPVGLIDATVSPDGGTVITSNLYPEVLPGKPFPTFGPQHIRAVTLSAAGGLTEVSQTAFPASFTAGLAGHVPAFFPPVLWPVPFGLTFNPDPNKKFVYVNATIAGRLAVYDYSNPASLTLKSNTMNPAHGSCWMTVSKDGRFLYNSDSASESVSVFAISSDGSTLTFKASVPLKSTGTPDGLRIDRSGNWLYVIGKHDDPDAPRPQGVHGDPTDPKTVIVPAPLPANFLDAYRIDQKTGMLKEISTIQLPIPPGNLPYGIDVLPKSS